MEDRKNIVLVGFMGTGKTTVGKELARILKWKFVDTDDEIVCQAGKSIPQIFAEEGEEHFRELEQNVIKNLLKGQQQVISSGGGAVLRQANRDHMLRGGFVVALTASEDTIYQRIKDDQNRPLLSGDVRGNLRKKLAEREQAYKFAHYTVATDELVPRSLAEHIISVYRNQKYDEN